MRATACLILLAAAAWAAPVPKPEPPDPLGRGYMGVYASTGGSGATTLVVSRVEPNSAASEAGVRSGDRFLRVGPLTPQTFDEVRELIGTLRPGTRIEILVKRGELEVPLVLTLGDRPPNFGSVELTEPIP